MHLLRTEDPGRIGDYTVLGRLGRGAMGTVYLCRSPGGRQVAVKVARPDLSDDPGFRERFRHEVAMARAVGGFWTAAVVDADPDAPRPWLATEYVPGPTLHEVVTAHGPLPEQSLRRLIAGLAEALLAIHATGLVHRDLKPSNVLLAADGPRVIDFGIAKALETTGLTATGMVVGTPGFLSPEQIAGGGVTPASDVFALGSVLVYAATGRGPFGTGDGPALMYRAVHSLPDLDGVPPGLRPIAARCLDRVAQARPTPGDLLAEVGKPAPAEWLPQRMRTVEGSAPATRPYTTVGGNRAVFRTSRLSALTWGAVAVAGSLTCSSIAGSASASGQDLAALLFVIGFVVLAVPAVRLLWSAFRPRRWVEVSGTGLTIGKGSRRRHLAWSQVARIRVVEDGKRPWLVVWLDGPPAFDSGLGIQYRKEHGGHRVFPVGHERRKRGRAREVRELRAALGWYAGAMYDGSP